LLLSFIFQGCNVQNEVKSPENILIEKIRERLENKDYVLARTLINPYDQIGKDVAEFNREISNDVNLRTRINQQVSNKKLSTYAGFFLPSSSSGKTWGTTDPEVLNIAKDKIQDFHEKKAKPFDSERIDQINDRLSKYSKDQTGVNEMLEGGFEQDAISLVQYEILKIAVNRISKAELVEANAINSTVEHEIILSGIGEDDKALLLSVTSIMTHDFEKQLSNLPNQPGPSQIFRKTAQVIIAVVIAAAVGAVLGGIAGSVICCLVQTNNCRFSCVADYIHDGAELGLTFGLIALVE
jgi:hypothetical protein